MTGTTIYRRWICHVETSLLPPYRSQWVVKDESGLVVARHDSQLVAIGLAVFAANRRQIAMQITTAHS